MAGLRGGYRLIDTDPYATRFVSGPDVMRPLEEAPAVSTNTTAQSSLIAIQVLELCKDRLPDEVPPRPSNPPRRRG